MREVRRRRRQQIEEAVMTKKKCSSDALAGILHLDPMPPPPRFLSSSKLHESLSVPSPVRFRSKDHRRRETENFTQILKPIASDKQCR